ncbi:hypothetical protein HOY80DRAFT_948306 [Tuber brumale]|nr:hypothetical protein HOY80DRAFT_948306 [Tuber brumale]
MTGRSYSHFLSIIAAFTSFHMTCATSFHRNDGNPETWKTVFSHPSWFVQTVSLWGSAPVLRRSSCQVMFVLVLVQCRGLDRFLIWQAWCRYKYCSSTSAFRASPMQGGQLYCIALDRTRQDKTKSVLGYRKVNLDG